MTLVYLVNMNQCRAMLGLLTSRLKSHGTGVRVLLAKDLETYFVRGQCLKLFVIYVHGLPSVVHSCIFTTVCVILGG
jgi:hypothetical protein